MLGLGEAGPRVRRQCLSVAASLALGLAFPGGHAAAEPARHFDYVVVGAGAAGSVLASRLSEHSGMTVLVLEAGGPDTDARLHEPGSYRELPGSIHDWKYSTDEEPHLSGRRIPWPRGKVWGGSGSLSATVYVRGHPRDFDLWERLGNPGWGWDDVLPYFKKAENQERGPSTRHGVGGPQNVADPRWVPPLSQAFVKAAQEIGLPRNEDFNGETQEGVGLYQLNQKNGERHSAASAYLRPALHRPNLTVESGALATRVLFEGRRAAGVAYVQDGITHEVRADREVLLCAGTIGSPQLLLLSGIGPAADLSSLGIPLIQDLPGVGGNLQDHPRVALTYRSRRPLGFETPADREAAVRDYQKERTGPLSSTGVGAGAFVRTGPEEAAPDVQIIPTASPQANTFSLHVALMRPASRGSVRLQSKDPTVPPLIRANYLAEERDLDVLVRGLEVARRIALADALSTFRGEEQGPGPGRWTGDDLRAFVRENVTTFFHPVGTCRMGRDALAVVDDELRVRGVDGLRVIDGSVMPTLIAGATHAAAVMIAERGAFLVKKGW